MPNLTFWIRQAEPACWRQSSPRRSLPSGSCAVPQFARRCFSSPIRVSTTTVRIIRIGRQPERLARPKPALPRSLDSREDFEARFRPERGRRTDLLHHLAWLRDRLNSAYQAGLQQIAEATGGTASFSRAPGDIAGDISRCSGKIGSHWAVDLELPAGTMRTYSVQLSVEGREIQYRTKYTLAPHAKGSLS